MEEQFPVLYENGLIRVYRNPTGEIFVQHEETNVTMRIHSVRGEGLQFTTAGRVEPVRVTNMIGWKVSTR